MGKDGELTPVTVEYEVTAGGSAVIERDFPGTPMEMMTVYHDDDGGALTLTHYCMLGNQPQLDLVASTDSVLTFYLREGSVTPAEAPHMHSLAMTIAPDRLVQDWAMWSDGQEQRSNPIELVRVAK